MTKRQLIDQITHINHSAKPDFLARFDDVDLDDYLQHLKVMQTPRLSGDSRRFDHYFEDGPALRLADTTLATVVSDMPDGQDTVELDCSELALFSECYEQPAAQDEPVRRHA